MVRLLELDGTTVGVKLRRVFFGVDICCRICLTPVYYLFYSSILEAVSEPNQVSIAIFVCWLVSALTIDLINVYCQGNQSQAIQKKINPTLNAKNNENQGAAQSSFASKSGGMLYQRESENQ
ncbi:unnamed protein product [Clavelina lepadiformis]|uniref:Uncharacterized protein n=1 Tax=Clavelina lepadiformis TaxID=159417 RepID=A0ABP0FT33_CLALP